MTYWLPVWVSLKVALAALLVIVVPGIALAWILARRDFPGKALLEAAFYAPLVMPPVITGYLMLLVLGKNGWIGSFFNDVLGLRLSFNFTGAVLAAAVMGFPLFLRSLRLGLELVDQRLEVAASTLGASPWEVFTSVTLPLARPGLITGLVLAFARGLGEFGATIVFAGNIQGETQTIPLAVFNMMQNPGQDDKALVLALLSVGISLVAIVLSEMSTRRMRAIQEPRR